MREVRWHGRGGQGAKTASHILAVAMLEAGKWVQAFPEFGPERTGAPVLAYNRSDDVPIRRRSAVTQPEAVVVLDGSLIGETDVVAGLAAGGLLIINTEESEPEVRHRLGFPGRTLCVPAGAIAASVGPRNMNLVMLGALARAIGEPPLQALEEAIRTTLGPRLTPQELALALAAVGAGYVSAQAETARPGSLAPVEAVRGPREPHGASSTPELRGYRELLPAATILAAEAPRMRTGGWRSGLKPRVDLARCVNCLLCWVYCPDAAIVLEGVNFVGFNYDVCKGCELCVEVCPTEAIGMVDEGTLLPPYGRIGG